MYKIIVTDEKDFEKLKSLATYYSNRTKVVCIEVDPSDEIFTIVAKYALENEISDNEDLKYIVSYNNGILIHSEDHELADFFGAFIKNGLIRVTVSEWWKIAVLLRHGILVPDDDFKQRFAPLSKKDNINKTKTWSMTTKFRNISWSFKNCANKTLGIDGDKGLQISSAKFLTSDVVLRNYKVVTGYVVSLSDDGKDCLFKDESNNLYHISVKGWPFRLNKNVWKKDKKITFNSSSKSNEIVNPIIIPRSLKIEGNKFNEMLNDFGYLCNRKCPTELLNRLKAEVVIRLSFNNEKL